MMFRLAKTSVVARGVCRYSTGPQDKLFLSDLLNRIEQINTKSKKIIETQRTQKDEKRAKSAAASRAPQKKVVVADHPLVSNKFKREASNARQDSPAQRSSRFREARPPRAQREDAQDRRPRPAGDKRSTQARPSRPGMRRRDGQRDSRSNSKKNAQTLGEVPAARSKVLKATPYAPEVNANTFFYGKIASVNSNLTSRVASVAKEQLIESKYPFKVPKAIIENLDDGNRNEFLLQKDYTLDLDSEAVTKRIQEVVKGQWEDLQVNPERIPDKQKSHLAEFTKNELMKNGSLPLQSKQVMFEVGNGLKSPKDLLKNAHWTRT